MGGQPIPATHSHLSAHDIRHLYGVAKPENQERGVWLACKIVLGHSITPRNPPCSGDLEVVTSVVGRYRG
jgi:hypothetical protein